MSANRPEMCLVLLTLLRISLEEIKSENNKLQPFWFYTTQNKKSLLDCSLNYCSLGWALEKKISFDLWPFFWKQNENSRWHHLKLNVAERFCKKYTQEIKNTCITKILIQRFFNADIATKILLTVCGELTTAYF